MSLNSFDTIANLAVNQDSFTIYALKRLEHKYAIKQLPLSLKIILENLLRHENDTNVRAQDITAVLNWQPKNTALKEIAFMPARVMMQDFTGVPALVDLAAMRDAMLLLNKNPAQINPLCQTDLVIDHSLIVDFFGSGSALAKNLQLEFERNLERYQFLRWAQSAFKNLRIIPPGTGIVHQINLEYLASVVSTVKYNQQLLAFPDTVVGTDSHTTMINALGVLGWGVGGIEAEAVMLGQPISMTLPEVIGVELTGQLNPATTSTDLVLTITKLLRDYHVVGKHVEFFGSALQYLTVADRATIANMAPEYGATSALFPIDELTLEYLKLTNRTKEQLELVNKYAHAQYFLAQNAYEINYSDKLKLDLTTVRPTIAGPKRPHDKILLTDIKKSIGSLNTKIASNHAQPYNGKLQHWDIVIAAITSCTNTSNPMLMLQAGLLAKKAVAAGLTVNPWIKASLAPGSRVVKQYLDNAGLTQYLDALGFNLVGYGCTTCIGNSGPLNKAVEEEIIAYDLETVAVLSGNRNFEGRIHPLVKNSYLASPPLVIAFAIAGTVNIDLTNEPLGIVNNKAIFLHDLWPSTEELHALYNQYIKDSLFKESYANIYDGHDLWQGLKYDNQESYAWNNKSTYIKKPPYLTNFSLTPPAIKSIDNAKVLLMLEDSITTDHISPAGNIAKNSPAGNYLLQSGIALHDFNSYGARRGNHEVMMRGTFANTRLKNKLIAPTIGPLTINSKKEQVFIYDAAMDYQAQKIDLIIIAGKDYGAGSSRDWAAKGTKLLGVVAVIAESFERIHRSNLIGMGILPLQFTDNQNAASLNLSGQENYSIPLTTLIPNGIIPIKTDHIKFNVILRIDSMQELEYYRHGGILPFTLRNLLKN